MTELEVTLMAIGAWVLAAGAAGFAGSFLVQRLRDRQAAKRGAERHVTAEPGVEPAASPALVLVRASGPAFAELEMAHAASTAA